MGDWCQNYAMQLAKLEWKCFQSKNVYLGIQFVCTCCLAIHSKKVLLL